MAIYPAEMEESLQDHPDIVAALKELKARMDVNEDGWIWRVILYEKNGDETLQHLRELPELKEVWVVGSRVTPTGMESLQEEFPELTVYK